MSKLKSFVATIVMLIMAFALVAVVSCKKESQATSINSEPTVQVADNMDEYLMAFKKRLLSAEKGGEAISLEQAERDLGNLLNFDFGDSNYATDEIQYDTLYVPLLVTGSNVDMAQLAKTYTSAYESILETYKQVELLEKSVLSIGCSIDQDSKKDDTVVIRLAVATRGLSQSFLKTSFDSTDNWRVWNELGKCDGTCVGKDHTTMIKKVYENNKGLLECHNGRIYYTDVTGGWGFNTSAFPENNSNNIQYNYGFRLWCGYGSEINSDSFCIEYPEMQYYYGNFCQIMEENAIWHQQQGHVIISIDECSLSEIVGVASPDSFYLFYCDYTTGKWNCTSVGLDY